MKEFGHDADAYSIWSELTSHQIQAETSALQISNWFKIRGFFCQAYRVNGAAVTCDAPCIGHVSLTQNRGHYVVLLPTPFGGMRVCDPNTASQPARLIDIDAIIVASPFLRDIENIRLAHGRAEGLLFMVSLALAIGGFVRVRTLTASTLRRFFHL